MERGVETGDLRQLRARPAHGVQPGERVRGVQRSEGHESAQPGFDAVVDTHRARKIGTAVDDAVADRVDRGAVEKLGDALHGAVPARRLLARDDRVVPVQE